MTAKLNITGTVRNMSDLKQVGEIYKLNISIPEDRYYNEKKSTAWHHITLWGEMAERASHYLANGSVVEVGCRIDYNESNGKYYTNFNATKIDYLAYFGDQKLKKAA